jgi:hypothetical protein
MKSFALALPLLLLPVAAWADEDELPRAMSLDDERKPQQDQETDPLRQENYESGDNSLTVMEFIYRHNQLEAGAMYTAFDNSLGLKSHLGYYLRFGVEIYPAIALNVTYRYNAFGDSPDGSGDDIVAQALFFGATLRVPLATEFAFIAGAGIGPMWWDSSLAGHELSLGLTAEAAFTARLYEAMRFKAGLVLDGTETDFHQSSSSFNVNLSFLFGLEFGF